MFAEDSVVPARRRCALACAEVDRVEWRNAVDGDVGVDECCAIGAAEKEEDADMVE